MISTPVEMTEEEKHFAEAERIIKGLDITEYEEYVKEENVEYDFQDCALDFDRELLFVRSNDDTVSILPFSSEMVINHNFDDFVEEYNKLNVNNFLTKLKLHMSKFFRMFAKEN